MTEPDVVVLRPPLWERVVTAALYGLIGLFGLVCPFFALEPGSSPLPFWIVFGTALAVIGIPLAVRAPRVSITLDDHAMRSVGFLVTRTIRRDAITVVLDDASVEWTTAAGAQRSTGLWIFRPAYPDKGEATARLWRWRREGLLQVRTWAHARAV